MLFMVINALISAALFVLVVVPPMFIFDPSKHHGESLGPPVAGVATAGDDVSHSVKQKLYMLFVIPACAVANAIFLYFTYYRPFRAVQYRVEMNVLALHEHRLLVRQQLQSAGFSGVPVATSTFAFPHTNSSFLAPERNTHSSARSFAHKASASFGGGSLNEVSAGDVQLKADFSRRARPKCVTTDAYIHSSFYPEVKRLMKTVENSFLRPSTVTEQELDKAVAQLTGEYPPSAPTGPILPHDLPSGFYTSKRQGGVNNSGGFNAAGGGGVPLHSPMEPIAGKVAAMHNRVNNSLDDGMELHQHRRNTSVILVLSDKQPGRRHSQSNGGRASGRRGSAQRQDDPHQPAAAEKKERLELDSTMSSPSEQNANEE